MSLVALIFLALMSTVYLQHLPSKHDLETLRIEIKGEFGVLLKAGAPLELDLLEPEREGRRLGLEITCSFRKELRRNPKSIGVEMDRMAQMVMKHRKWRGKVDLVKVVHVSAPKLERVHRAAERA
ncbi:MAG: hypothetical protein ACYTGN_13185 [Planctomycetota bacterium]|jgi:hypothetical protein